MHLSVHSPAHQHSPGWWTPHTATGSRNGNRRIFQFKPSHLWHVIMTIGRSMDQSPYIHVLYDLHMHARVTRHSPNKRPGERGDGDYFRQQSILPGIVCQPGMSLGLCAPLKRQLGSQQTHNTAVSPTAGPLLQGPRCDMKAGPPLFTEAHWQTPERFPPCFWTCFPEIPPRVCNAEPWLLAHGVSGLVTVAPLCVEGPLGAAQQCTAGLLYDSWTASGRPDTASCLPEAPPRKHTQTNKK